jgi:S-adenosyl-L-methionine hydrolase (adenosine-forming)
VTRPIVFCTDYGTADEYVGVCHGVIARIAPDARVIDLSHAVPRQDVLRGSLTIGRAAPYMPDDAVYVGVVDPGVGSDRRAIAVLALRGPILVGPDNGLLSLAWEALGGPRSAVEIENPAVMVHPVSTTFHGRDVFAPAAAHLANGLRLEELGSRIDVAGLTTLEMPGPMIAHGALGTRVIGVDGFGNVQLNARPEDLDAAGLGDPLTVAGRTLPRVRTFADVPEGALASIVDSQGFVSLVLNHGNASAALDLREGAGVVVE